jgi:hypothetical protein
MDGNTIREFIGIHAPTTRREGLKATCSGDFNLHARAVLRPPYRYMWYYRTEVRNTLEVPLRVIWFEGFTRRGWLWVPSNIMRRTLTGTDFTAWYSDGPDAIMNGLIPPYTAAICSCNWHGSNYGPPGPVKWAYIAVDPSGVKYYARVILERKFVPRTHH